MRYIFLLILIVFQFETKAQTFLSAINLNQSARIMNTDELGNVYVVFDDNSLVKYSPEGDSLANFRGIQNGRLSQIDTRNPLKVLLFYPEYNKLLILDRMLSPKNEIDLRRLNLFQVAAVGMAMDGNIWVYDVNNVQLIKIDDNATILSRSDDLRSALQTFIQPVFLEEGARKVYILDPEKGIFVFDRFANYLNNIYIQGLKQMQSYNEFLVYSKGDSLYTYNINTFETTQMVIPEKESVIMTRIEQRKLYLLQEKKISIYSL